MKHKLHIIKTEYEFIRHYIEEKKRGVGKAVKKLDRVEKNLIGTSTTTEEFCSIYNLERRRFEIREIDSKTCRYKTIVETI